MSDGMVFKFTLSKGRSSFRTFAICDILQWICTRISWENLIFSSNPLNMEHLKLEEINRLWLWDCVHDYVIKLQHFLVALMTVATWPFRLSTSDVPLMKPVAIRESEALPLHQMTYTEHVSTSNLSPATFVTFISFCGRSNEAESSWQTTVAQLCCCSCRRRNRFPRRLQLIIKAPVTCVNSGEQEAQIEIDFSDTVMIISMEDIQCSQAHKRRALVILGLWEPVGSGMFFFFF